MITIRLSVDEVIWTLFCEKIEESTSAIGTKKLLIVIACRFFDNDKYERSEIEWRLSHGESNRQSLP